MTTTKILDGYLTLIETWGCDERVIESARMSTSKGFLGWGPSCSQCGIRMVETLDGISPGDYETEAQKKCTHDAKKHGDEKLLRYLWENKHHTPFEMAGATFEVEAPIFVFREWHRHRTESYNEMSGRYIELQEKFYVPDVDRVRFGGQSTSNKQASGSALSDPVVALTRMKIQDTCHQAFVAYREMLADGVAKEIARTVLPVGTYSRMRASANLRNWLGFLTLRNDGPAQWEIRQYAVALQAMLASKYSRTLQLFQEGRSA